MAKNRSSESGKYVKKDYAQSNPNVTVEEKDAKMHPVTRIFDLVRQGKFDEARKKVKRLNAESREALRLILTLLTEIERGE